MRKKKVYIASSVMLPGVPEAHRGNNENCQFSIVCRADSQEAVARLCGVSVRHLRIYGGIHEARQPLAVHVLKDDTIYYHAEHTKTGYLNTWHEYIGKNR